MSFKVMGVTAGCYDNSCEILLNEALLVCQEQGAEISTVCLSDYELPGNRNYFFDHNYDSDIIEVLLSQDAVIFAAPVYALIPSSLFLKFIQHSLVYETEFLTRVGAIMPRTRFGALIAVGGSAGSYQPASLENMENSVFSDIFKMIDVYTATIDPAPAQILLYEAKLARARMIGSSIMEGLRLSARAPISA